LKQPNQDLLNFAAEIGAEDEIVVRGGKTQWEVGGLPSSSAREVKAPAGVRSFEPEDMVVRCGAGTTLEELAQVLGESGQMVPVERLSEAQDNEGVAASGAQGNEVAVSGAQGDSKPTSAQPTIGGTLAVGHSGYRRLRYGPIRDLLLETTFVDSEGQLIRSGGPTVKNVSGYDLCRLMVGSLGTLGCLGEVVLRCHPIPKRSQWFATNADPFALLGLLWQPSSILWNGRQTWVLLEGHPEDISSQAEANGLEDCAPPHNQATQPHQQRPTSYPQKLTAGWQRFSLNPAILPSLTNHFKAESFVAEVGVGIVHLPSHLRMPRELLPIDDARSLTLQRKIKSRFDPRGRLNPGRKVWDENNLAATASSAAAPASAAVN